MTHFKFSFTERLSKVVGDEHAIWLESKFEDFDDDYECVDNLRAAVKGDSGQEAEYERSKSEGCCGYFDGEVTHPDGTVYLIGFNYGH